MADLLQFTTPSPAETEEEDGEGEGMAKQSSRAKPAWTDDEIDDLLLGVETYGADNWRLILEDPNFTFDQREVADLKYQFRKTLEGPLPTPSHAIALRQTIKYANVSAATGWWDDVVRHHCPGGYNGWNPSPKTLARGPVELEEMQEHMRQTKLLEAREQAARAAKAARVSELLQESVPTFLPCSRPSPAGRSIGRSQLGPASRPVETSTRGSGSAPVPEIRVTRPSEPVRTEAAQGSQSGPARRSGSAPQSVQTAAQGLLHVPAPMRRQRLVATTTPFPPPSLILGSTQGSRRASASRNLRTPVQDFQLAPPSMPLEVPTAVYALSQTPRPTTDTKYKVRDRKSKTLGRRQQYKASEDDSILRGFETYGRQWQVVQADASLCLGHRTTTGLRKRFSHLCDRLYGSRRHPTESKEEGAAGAPFGGSANPSKRRRDENASPSGPPPKAAETRPAADAPSEESADHPKRRRREIPSSKAPADERVRTRAADDAPSGESAGPTKPHDGKGLPSAPQTVTSPFSPSSGPVPKLVARQAHLAPNSSLEILVAVGDGEEIRDAPCDIIRRGDCDLYDDEVVGEDEFEDAVKLEVDDDPNPARGSATVAVARCTSADDSAGLAARALEGPEEMRLVPPASIPTASAPRAMSEAQYVDFVKGLWLAPSLDSSQHRATSTSTLQLPTETPPSASSQHPEPSPDTSAAPESAPLSRSSSGHGVPSPSTLGGRTTAPSSLPFRHRAPYPYTSAGPTSTPFFPSSGHRVPSFSALQVPTGASSFPSLQTRAPTPCTLAGPTSAPCSSSSSSTERRKPVSAGPTSAPSDSSTGGQILPYVSPLSTLARPPTFPPSDATMPALQYGGPVPSGACQMPGHVDRRSPSASGATPAHTYSRTYNASSAFQFDPRWSAAANASSIDSTPAESFEYLLDAACDSGSDDYELVKYPETIADNTTADGAATETGSEAMLAEISESNAETTTPQEATPVNSVDSVSAIGTSASGVHTPAASDDAVPAKISETITDVTTTEAIT